MRTALSCSRMQTPKATLRATYSPDSGRVRVGHPRGTHFRTMGTAVKKGGGDGDGGEGGAGVVMLKEEEALYLVERGALELRYEVTRGEDDTWGGGDGVFEEEEEEEEEQKEGIREKQEERGAKGRTEEMGIPMSVQAAYTFLIGAGHGLTLERFIVYSGLKRSGYIVLRAPGWDGEEEHGDGACGKVKNEHSGDAAHMPQQQQPLGWFSRIYKALWASIALGEQRHHHRPGAGPLVGLGVYRSYSQYYPISITHLLHKTDRFFLVFRILRNLFYDNKKTRVDDIYRLLSIIPTYDPTALQLETADTLQQHEPPPSEGPRYELPPSPPPLRPCFHVWKPHLNFKKSSPATPPDFYIAVIDARHESTFPTLSQLDSLLRSVPPDPPTQPLRDGAKQGEGGGGAAKQQRQYQSRLKHGWRNVILAVVDEGVVSYLRIGEGAFGMEKLFELEGREAGGGGGGGKRGGGSRGRGRGRGRGGRGGGGGG